MDVASEQTLLERLSVCAAQEASNLNPLLCYAHRHESEHVSLAKEPLCGPVSVPPKYIEARLFTLSSSIAYFQELNAPPIAVWIACSYT